MSLSKYRRAGRTLVSSCKASRGTVRNAPEITLTPSLKTSCVFLMREMYLREVAQSWHTGRQTALETRRQLAMDRPLCVLPRT
jgi:hypothetical protein